MPRKKLFISDEAGNCPLPSKYVDVVRLTRTNLDTLAEKGIEGIWYDAGPGELFSKEKGSTTYNILQPKPRDGFTWVDGRETAIKTTTIPGNVRPESWTGMSDKQRQKAVDRLAIKGKARDTARDQRGSHLSQSDGTKYKKFLGEARAKYAPTRFPQCN